MNQEQIQVFVEANKRAVSDTNRLARCVDGRYENISDMPLIAKPGADAGDVMALFGAINLLGQTGSLTEDRVLKIVVDTVGGPENFRFHSDDHADTATLGLGCGHIKQAKLDPQSYAVTQDQIDFIFSSLPSLVEQGAKQEVLHGDHAEQAVVVVDSENYGVEPLLRGEEVQEAFIYQKSLHTVQLNKMTKLLQEALAESGKVVEEQEIGKALDDAFGKQLTETLQRLAKGLPVYVATISENGTVEISS